MQTVTKSLILSPRFRAKTTFRTGYGVQWSKKQIKNALTVKMYSHDFLLSRERFRVFGLDALSVGFWVTDLNRRSMISSVASSCELALSSLATDMGAQTLPKPV